MKKTWRGIWTKLSSGLRKPFLPAQPSTPIGAAARPIRIPFRKAKWQNPVRSVGMKLFLLIFCSILVCVGSLGWFSYHKSSSIIQQKVAQASSQTAEQTAGKLSLLLSGYERQSLQFITDNQFMTLLGTLGAAKDDFERFDTARKVTQKLSSVAVADSTLESISLIPLQGNGQLMTTGTAMSGDALIRAPFIDEMKRANGRPVWIPTRPHGMDGKRPAPTLAVGRLLNQNTPYVLLLEVRIDALQKQMNTVKFADSHIVAADGTLVYDAAAAQLGNKYESPIPNGTETITINGTDTLSSAGTIAANGWMLIGNIPVASLVEDAKQIRNLTFILSGVAVLIAAVIGLAVMRGVGRPLGQLRTLMNAAQQGDLTVRSDIVTRDEIGQLAHSFNRMMEEITALVGQTNQSAADVLDTAASLAEASRQTSAAAKEIASATEEIAGGAMNLAVESERGSELTTRIGSQIQSVVASNEQMGYAAGEVEEAGRRGSQYMSALIEKTGQTEEMTRSMVDKVDKLKDSTRSIRKILDILVNVSQQTNILSLNAAIEAARAGNAGKGFMVVADEIRRLADQSRQSIRFVGEIVENIQREIEETVSVLSEAYPVFQEQIDSVREANGIFLRVQENMGGFIGRLDAATGSVRHLEEVQSTLSMAMTNVSAVAQQSSATSEEVASLSSQQLNISDGLVALSGRLETVSSRLRESLSRFTVS